MNSVYEATIRALKDFTVARDRLIATEKEWDKVRPYLASEDPHNGSNVFFFAGLFMKPEYLANRAIEFYRAKRAYDCLGEGLCMKCGESPDFCRCNQGALD